MSITTKYIILAGTSKAATTSVFNYLADHPKICGSHIKQTNYFLNQDTQDSLGLHSTYSYTKDFKDYKNYFNSNNQEKYNLEATPDYMYYPETINRLQSFSNLYDTKIVLILRHPVSRFKSWYNFGKQQGSIDQNITFKDYYKKSKEYLGDSNPSLMAYKTGFYSNYLKTIFDAFKREDIIICFYEDLTSNPQDFMLELSDNLNIEKQFYNNYNFSHFNKTVKTKSKLLNKTYNGFRSFYIKFLNKGKLGVKIGQYLKNILSPLYKKINTTKISTDHVDQDIIKKLHEDYQQEILKIKTLIPKTPW